MQQASKGMPFLSALPQGPPDDIWRYVRTCHAVLHGATRTSALLRLPGHTALVCAHGRLSFGMHCCSVDRLYYRNKSNVLNSSELVGAGGVWVRTEGSIAACMATGALRSNGLGEETSTKSRRALRAQHAV